MVSLQWNYDTQKQTFPNIHFPFSVGASWLKINQAVNNPLLLSPFCLLKYVIQVWNKSVGLDAPLLNVFMMTSSNGTFSALLVICAGNSPASGEFPVQRPGTRSFDVFFDLRLNKRLSKQSRAGDLKRHRVHYDVTVMIIVCFWALPHLQYIP